MKPSRKYGAVHKTYRKRAALVVEAGQGVCWRCERPIHPDEQWHPPGTHTLMPTTGVWAV